MTENSSTYFMNAESLVEVARLINQDRLVTKEVGLLPTGVNARAFERVLDIGSGPGGWLLDLVRAYPYIQGIGIDTSEKMVQMSTLLAQAEGKSLLFKNMDARETLDFPDESFDYIQMRLTHSFIRPSLWPAILRDTYRLLKPGGWLRVTDLEMTISNKQHTEDLYAIIPVVWTKAHRSMSPTGRSIGLLPRIKPLLSASGYRDLELSLYPMEAADDRKDNTFEKESVALVYTRLYDLLLQVGGYSKEQLTELFEKALVEIDHEDYKSISIMLSCLGRKPEGGKEEAL